MNTSVYTDITLLTPAQVTDLTHVPKATLKKWRAQRTHLPYVHMGRSVYYRLEDVRAYIDAHTVQIGGEE